MGRTPCAESGRADRSCCSVSRSWCSRRWSRRSPRAFPSVDPHAALARRPGRFRRGRSSDGDAVATSSRSRFVRSLSSAHLPPSSLPRRPCRVCGLVEPGRPPGVDQRVSRREPCRDPTAAHHRLRNSDRMASAPRPSSGLAGRPSTCAPTTSPSPRSIASASTMEHLSDSEHRGTSARPSPAGRRRRSEPIRTEFFALVREASRRALGLRPFDVQVLAALALDAGHIVEMQTGEGKTLAAVMPASLNALTGKGVHVLTFNDYLARRDAEWMGPVYAMLGLSVGFVQQGMTPEERRLRLPRRRHLRDRQGSRIRSPPRSAGDRSSGCSCTGRSTSRSSTKPTRC